MFFNLCWIWSKTTTVSSFYKENNFKPCLTKQLLNTFKLWCEWGTVFVSRLHDYWVISYLVIYTVHFMLIKYTFGSKSLTLRMRYPFQSTGRPISHRNGWSFRVYMIPLQDFVPEWNSRSGTRTGVNSRRGDSRRHNILGWYHVNKYRAMRGNRSELSPGRKLPRCHVKTP